MKKIFIPSLILILLLVSACVDPIEENDPPDYVLGQVVVGLYDSIDTEFYTRYIYDLEDIEIEKIGYTYYYVPGDSSMIASITDTLISRSYIYEETNMLRYIADEGRLRLFVRFHDFGLNELDDWLDLCEDYGITREGLRDYFLLGVENGTEEDWVDVFEEDEYFRYAELNGIIRIDPIY